MSAAEFFKTNHSFGIDYLGNMTKFFYHIPKTAGTSLKRVLEGWFNTSMDASLTIEGMRRIAKKKYPEFCIHGHFGGALISSSAGLLARYPWIVGSEKAAVFTFLRDPIDHAISFYYHQVKHGRTQLSLTDFIKDGHEFAYHKTLEITRDEEIEAALCSFSFVGIVEEMDASIEQLARRFDKEPAEVPVFRIGSRDTQLTGVTDALVDELRETTYQLDYAIYERARQSISGEQELIWDATNQFKYLSKLKNLQSTISQSRTETPSVASLVSMEILDADGTVTASPSVDTPLQVRVTFEVMDEREVVQPALRFYWKTETAFVVAFTPEDRSVRFSKGKHSVVATIPPNLLNVGRYEIEASLTSPSPVKRFDVTRDLALIEIREAASQSKTAQGDWTTPFPGPVRPLVDWQSNAAEN